MIRIPRDTKNHDDEDEDEENDAHEDETDYDGDSMMMARTTTPITTPMDRMACDSESFILGARSQHA